MNHSFISRFTRFPVIHYHKNRSDHNIWQIQFLNSMPWFQIIFCKNTKNIWFLLVDLWFRVRIASYLQLSWLSSLFLLVKSSLTSLLDVQVEWPAPTSSVAIAPTHLKKSGFSRLRENHQNVKESKHFYRKHMEISWNIYIYLYL